MKELCRRDIAMGDYRVLGQPPVSADEAEGRPEAEAGQHEAVDERCHDCLSHGVARCAAAVRIGHGFIQGSQGVGGDEEGGRVEGGDADGG